MLNLIAIFLGGGIGAVSRFLISLNLTKIYNVNLPIATFLVNIIGSFAIGFLYILFMGKTDLIPALKFALTVGFCGGLTTFSTFSLELFEMISHQQFMQAAIYALLSVLVCLVMTGIGVYCAKLI